MFTFNKICIQRQNTREENPEPIWKLPSNKSIKNYLWAKFVITVTEDHHYIQLQSSSAPHTVISNWFNTAWVSCGKTTQNSSNKQTSPPYQTSPCCDTWLYFLNVYLYIPAEYRLIPNKWICYPCKYKHGARVRIMAGTPAHLPRTCQFGVFPPNPEPWHTNLCFCNSFSDLFSISISLNHPFHSHQLQHSVAILTVRYSRRKKHFYSLFGFPSTGTYFQQQGI